MKDIRFFSTLISSIVSVLVHNSAAQVPTKKFPDLLQTKKLFAADTTGRDWFPDAMHSLRGSNPKNVSIAIVFPELLRTPPVAF